MANVVAFDSRPKVLSESEALDWLRLQPNGRADANTAALGERWGWTRQRVARRLRTWQDAGLINRSGKILIVAIKEVAPVAVKEVAPVASLAAPAAPSDTAHVSLPPAPTLPATIAPAVPAVVRARALPAIAPAIRAAMAPTIPTAIAPAIPAAIAPAIPAAVTPMVGPAIAPGGSRPTAVIVGATAVCLAAVGLVLNANFASSLGQTGLAAALLAAIGLAVDLLAVALPTAASRLWHARHRAAAFAAGLIWVCALAMMLLAGIGFASVNIGDTVAARAKVANEGVALTARFERLRDERVAIGEQRSIAALEAELQRVQPSAQSVWKATNGCRDVTLARSSKACDGVLRLREAIGAAQQRDAVEAEMRVVEGQLALLPAIRQGDPQAQTTSDLVAWLSNGLVAPSAQDIHRLRVVGLTLAPACAGLLFWMAVALWRRPERDECVRAV
jgi:hypothetical protein